MQITTALLSEHGLLYAQFDYLEQMLPTITTLPQLQCQVARLGMALHSHAHLEDKLLFTTLDSYVDEISPLVMMRREHDGLEHALVALPRIQDLRKAHAGVQFVLEVARCHFAREERLLYPLAQTVLSDKELHQLGEHWATQQVHAVCGRHSIPDGEDFLPNYFGG